MSLESLQLWGHWGAPNPWKVAMILETLNLPYTIHYLELNEVKTDSYLAMTPNGRLPTLKDPNTGLVMWESGAIIQYLVEQYDISERISYRSFPEKWHAQQWLSFQISGQGPYYGQATWFARFHPERLPSATTRYLDEIVRVIGVIELGLERNESGWLVGSKCTVADLSFRTWAAVGEGLLREVGRFDGIEQKYPLYTAWLKAMDQFEGVKKIQDKMAEGRKAHGLK